MKKNEAYDGKGMDLPMCVRACLMYLSVGCLVANSQPHIPQTSTSGTHTHIDNITATYKINDGSKQRR